MKVKFLCHLLLFLNLPFSTLLADGGATCATATVITLPAAAPYADSGTTCGKGNTYSGHVCSANYSLGEDALYELNVTAQGVYSIAISGTAGWSSILVTDGCPDAAPACLAWAGNDGTSQSVIANFPSAGTYYLQIDTYPTPNCTAYNLAITQIITPGNDECANATVINSNNFAETIDASTATTGAGDPVTICGGQVHNGSVWYTFTPVSSGTVDIETCGSNYDTVLALWSGSCGSLTAVTCDDDTCSVASQISGQAVNAGTTYFIEICEFGSSLQKPDGSGREAGGLNRAPGTNMTITFSSNSLPVTLERFQVE